MSRDLEIFYPERRFLNFYVAPLLSDEENPSRRELVGRAIILRDTTEERRETEETIESERFSAVTLLAAGVAHEIGNPLNSLDIQLQLLERRLRKPVATEEEREKLAESVAVARSEVGRLDQIITQFLKAVRPAPLECVPTDFNTAGPGDRGVPEEGGREPGYQGRCHARKEHPSRAPRPRPVRARPSTT